jgi:hypothetical protein
MRRTLVDTSITSHGSEREEERQGPCSAPCGHLDLSMASNERGTNGDGMITKENGVRKDREHGDTSWEKHSTARCCECSRSHGRSQGRGLVRGRARACMGSFLGRVTARSSASPAPTTTRSVTSARIGRNWSAYWFSHTNLRGRKQARQCLHQVSLGKGAPCTAPIQQHGAVSPSEAINADSEVSCFIQGAGHRAGTRTYMQTALWGMQGGLSNVRNGRGKQKAHASPGSMMTSSGCACPLKGERNRACKGEGICIRKGEGAKRMRTRRQGP